MKPFKPTQEMLVAVLPLDVSEADATAVIQATMPIAERNFFRNASAMCKLRASELSSLAEEIGMPERRLLDAKAATARRLAAEFWEMADQVGEEIAVPAAPEQPPEPIVEDRPIMGPPPPPPPEVPTWKDLLGLNP
jgi:hypothetical protein